MQATKLNHLAVNMESPTNRPIVFVITIIICIVVLLIILVSAYNWCYSVCAEYACFHDWISARKLTCILKKVHNNAHYTVLDVSDSKHELWVKVHEMFTSTWPYSEQTGRDAVNLHDTSLEIKRILAIQNPQCWRKYCACLDSKMASGKLDLFYDGFPSVLRYYPAIPGSQSDSDALHINEQVPAPGASALGDADVQLEPVEEVTLTLDDLLARCEGQTMVNANNRILNKNSKSAKSLVTSDSNIADKVVQHHMNKVGSTPPESAPVSPTLKQLMTLTSINEAFLFHGTTFDNLTGLFEHGFMFDKARSWSLYGRGMYFTDSCQKADQYCDVMRERRTDSLAMLIVRVVLGDVETFEDVGSRMDVDTVLAGKGKRYREYIKHHDCQVYPAFAVLFDRSKRPLNDA